MAKTAMIRARTEVELKEEVEGIFSQLGLTQTEAINIFYRQVALNKGLPFSVKLPNEETLEAIEASCNNEGEVFESTEGLFEDLGI